MLDSEVEVVRPQWPNNRADIVSMVLGAEVIVELQNSPVTQQMIEEREEAYQNVVWIVNVQGYRFEAGNGRFNWPRANQAWAAAKNVLFDTGEALFGRLMYWQAAPSVNWDGEVYPCVHENIFPATQGPCIELARPVDRDSVIEALSKYTQAREEETKAFLREQEEFPKRRLAHKAEQAMAEAKRKSEIVAKQPPTGLLLEFALLDMEVTKSMEFKTKFRKRYGREPSERDLAEARKHGWTLMK